jgi:hypothetical protein
LEDLNVDDTSPDSCDMRTSRSADDIIAEACRQALNATRDDVDAQAVLHATLWRALLTALGHDMRCKMWDALTEPDDR